MISTVQPCPIEKPVSFYDYCLINNITRNNIRSWIGREVRVLDISDLPWNLRSINLKSISLSGSVFCAFPNLERIECHNHQLPFLPDEPPPSFKQLYIKDGLAEDWMPSHFPKFLKKRIQILTSKKGNHDLLSVALRETRRPGGEHYKDYLVDILTTKSSGSGFSERGFVTLINGWHENQHRGLIPTVLSDRDFPINASSSWQMPLLHCACSWGDIDLFEQIVKLRPDVDLSLPVANLQLKEYGKTPLDLAMDNGSETIIAYLQKNVRVPPT